MTRIDNIIKENGSVRIVEVLPSYTNRSRELLPYGVTMGIPALGDFYPSKNPSEESIVASATAIGQGVNSVATITVRDRLKWGTHSRLALARLYDLENLLIVRGDASNGLDGNNGYDTADLITETRLNHHRDFCIGAPVNQYATNLDQEIERAFRKNDADVDYFVTNAALEAGNVLDIRDRLRESGIHRPVIGNIGIPTGRRNLEVVEKTKGIRSLEETKKRLKERGDLETGKRIAIENTERLKKEVDGFRYSLLSRQADQIAAYKSLLEQLECQVPLTIS